MKGKSFTSAKGDDNVYTPYSMTEQLLENEEFDYNKTVLEPASGEGAITNILRNKFKLVYDNDISYHEDFLDYEKWALDGFENILMPNYIITNPPYSQLDKFIKKAKEIAIDKFAFLCKLTHLGGIDRLNNNVFKDENYPLTKVYLFVRQANLRFTNKKLEEKGYFKYRELREDGKYPAGMYYYCFLIWERSNKCYERQLLNFLPVLKWIDNNKYIVRKKDKIS
jgi:hypothetical protein